MCRGAWSALPVHFSWWLAGCAGNPGGHVSCSPWRPGITGADGRRPDSAYRRALGAEQRIRRFLAIPGQTGLHHAARELGIRPAILASQVRQLEDAAGITLLRTQPDGTIPLTADGGQFARNALAAFNMIVDAREAWHYYIRIILLFTVLTRTQMRHARRPGAGPG